MYKVKQNISSTLSQDLFPIYENSYNLRNNRYWQTSNVRTVGFGTETLLFRGRETWQVPPESIIKNQNLYHNLELGLKIGSHKVSHAGFVKYILTI